MWWDGQGSSGGVTKPKFFDAHNLISSSITGLTFKNTPVQMMSIDDATDLTITDVTQNNLDGNTGDSSTEAVNTDAFDIGSSTGVTITGAVINNQDDCLAINSGTCKFEIYRLSFEDMVFIKSKAFLTRNCSYYLQ